MQPTKDERILAAFAHASIIINIFNMIGMIATVLIWVTQRERSAYVRQHALQALLYQGITLLVSIILMLGWGLCLGLALLPMALRPELYGDHTLPASFWLALAGLVIPTMFGICATLYGLFGAFQTSRGMPFHYPLVGRLAEREFAVGMAVAPASTASPAATDDPADPTPVSQSAPVSTPAETTPVAAPITPPTDSDKTPSEE